MKYKHLFFDLDHTLWDFEKNAEECLQEIFLRFQHYIDPTLTFADFFATFSLVNKALWHKLDLNLITHDYLRTTRFLSAFEKLSFEVSEETSLAMNDAFLDLLPTKSHLILGTKDLLENLRGKYKLHIISNGYLPIQTRKMESGGILHFFDKIVTNDVANARKPDRAIFDYALQVSGASIADALMIGDNAIADIEGANKAGLKAIHLDESKQTEGSHVIYRLEDLHLHL